MPRGARMDELRAFQRLLVRGLRSLCRKLIACCLRCGHPGESRPASGYSVQVPSALRAAATMSEIPLVSTSALTYAIGCPCLVFVSLMAGLVPAAAYRPFDGTDAAVAEKGTLEIEMQPAGVRKDESGTTLIAPATRFNYGFTDNWEAVLEGQLETPLSPSGPSSLRAAGAFLKGVLREGSLQDKTGPSVATEFGVLLPDSRGDSHKFGASLGGVVSQRWDWGAIHLNGVAELTREQHADLFASVIIEGPSKWTVRPVAEVFYEKEFGTSNTVSGLVGLIWQVREELAIDFGVRHAVTSGHSVNEVRAGLTVGFPLVRSMSSPARR